MLPRLIKPTDPGIPDLAVDVEVEVDADVDVDVDVDVADVVVVTADANPPAEDAYEDALILML